MGREVSAGENVGGGEGGGCFDAVEEQDFVLGGEEEDAASLALAVEGVVWYRCIIGSNDRTIVCKWMLTLN